MYTGVASSPCLAVCAFLLLSSQFATSLNLTTGLHILTPEESRNLSESRTAKRGFEAQFAKAGPLPPDNGGNWGDLIYRRREQGDTLLYREVVIVEELSSSELDVQWYVSLKARRISSVRVLNIGRQRAYCLRIDVAAADAQAILRVRPYLDPRVLIEVYGYY